MRNTNLWETSFLRLWRQFSPKLSGSSTSALSSCNGGICPHVEGSKVDFASGCDGWLTDSWLKRLKMKVTLSLSMSWWLVDWIRVCKDYSEGLCVCVCVSRHRHVFTDKFFPSVHQSVSLTKVFISIAVFGPVWPGAANEASPVSVLHRATV